MEFAVVEADKKAWRDKGYEVVILISPAYGTYQYVSIFAEAAEVLVSAHEVGGNFVAQLLFHVGSSMPHIAHAR